MFVPYKQIIKKIQRPLWGVIIHEPYGGQKRNNFIIM
jgi:hypothetical protein